MTATVTTHRIEIVEPKVTLLSTTRGASAVLRTSESARLTLSVGLHHKHVYESGTADEKADLERIAHTIKSGCEFVQFIFLIENVSRSFLRQLVRSRAVSYAHQAQRAFDMSGAEAFKIVLPYGAADAAPYIEAAESALLHYMAIIDAGGDPEDASVVLPDMAATNLVVSCGLRALLGWSVCGVDMRVINRMRAEAERCVPWVGAFLRKGKDFWRAVISGATFASEEAKAELLELFDLL